MDVALAPLLDIEDRVLPPAIVPGPAAHDDLPSYYIAANPEAHDRAERIRQLFESNPNGTCRAMTLVAGDAGVGKTFLKKQVFTENYPAETVLKLDIREQYEQWQQEGTVQLRPDLHSGDVVINRLLARVDPNDEPLLRLLRATKARFIVIDSIDELHPDEYVPTLRQLEKVALLADRPFTHIAVFGRPCAFVDYWKEGVRNCELDIQLFTLQAPQFRTTGDLLVSSWNYCTWKFSAQCSGTEGQCVPLPLARFAEWSRAGFSRSGPFADIMVKATDELEPQVRDAFVQYAQQHRMTGPLLRNLAGNSILREIVMYRVHAGLQYDEREIMEAYFQAWLERDCQSDGRPSFQHPDHLDLYLQLLERVAVRYCEDSELDEEGYFTVADSDHIRLVHQGRMLEFPVHLILDRSGLKHMDPHRAGPRQYRFEPIWLHRHLVLQHHQRATRMSPLSAR